MQSRSFVYGKSEARKWPKKGSLWLPEVLINNVYFRWEKRATPESCQVRKGRIFIQERTKFLPGGLRQNVRKITLGEFGTPHTLDVLIGL
jgi:hypothetical protein